MTIEEARVFHIKYRGWPGFHIARDQLGNMDKIREYKQLNISKECEEQWFEDNIKQQRTFDYARVSTIDKSLIRKTSFQKQLKRIRRRYSKIYKYVLVNDWGLPFIDENNYFNIRIDIESISTNKYSNSIEYSEVDNPISPEEFLIKAWYEHFKSKSKVKINDLISISEGGDWLISIKDEITEELNYIALIKLDENCELQKVIVEPYTKLLCSDTMRGKLIYCKYIGKESSLN